MPALAMSLRSMIDTGDIPALTEYIVNRYDAIVADFQVSEVICALAHGLRDAEHYLEARLRSELRKLGCFERMFGEPSENDFSAVWNPLHWPWEPGLKDEMTDAQYVRWLVAHDPAYVRSRISRVEILIQPVNMTAFKVATPPSRQSRYIPCLSGATLTLPNRHGVKQHAYAFARKHGMQARVRQVDDEQIEVRFESCEPDEPASDQGHASSADERTTPAAGNSIPPRKLKGGLEPVSGSSELQPGCLEKLLNTQTASEGTL